LNELYSGLLRVEVADEILIVAVLTFIAVAFTSKRNWSQFCCNNYNKIWLQRNSTIIMSKQIIVNYFSIF